MSVLASEELAGIVQGLPCGSHIAVRLSGLDFAGAMRVSRLAAAARGDHLVVISGREHQDASILAESLLEAFRLDDLVVRGRDTLLVVDAHTSVERGGALVHAAAEEIVSLRPGLRLTVVCFYTEAAVAAVTVARVLELHSMVAGASPSA